MRRARGKKYFAHVGFAWHWPTDRRQDFRELAWHHDRLWRSSLFSLDWSSFHLSGSGQVKLGALVCHPAVVSLISRTSPQRWTSIENRGFLVDQRRRPDLNCDFDRCLKLILTVDLLLLVDSCIRQQATKWKCLCVIVVLNLDQLRILSLLLCWSVFDFGLWGWLGWGNHFFLAAALTLHDTHLFNLKWLSVVS